MPDPRRLYRRVTQSNLPTRLIAHISVLSLVAVATLVGLGQVQPASTVAARNDFFSLIQRVRGAADEPLSTEPVLIEINGMPEDEAQELDRSARGSVPVAQAPMPTPVPLDPNATPLPAPRANTGTTSTAAGPTTRQANPAPATGALVWPVPAGSISQYYHAGHLALDIAAPYGSQVVAAQNGVVTWAGWRNNGGGNVIEIDHGNGVRTVYNHLGGLWVGAGQWVSAGQAIAPVGCTGLCTGPHVHYEVIVNGIIDNPLRYY